MSEHKQLSLHLSPPERLGFADYLGAANRLAVSALERAVMAAVPGRLFLWGPGAVGKSHLLQAACAAADSAIYLPLGTLVHGEPKVLDGVEQAGLVCIDDLDRALGREGWEEALFHLLNRALGAHATVVVSAARPPRRCGAGLPDLSSRLSAMEVYALHPPRDADLAGIFQACAHRRGMRIGDEVVAYLLRRHRRDLGWLLRVLDSMEEETLRAQRPVTLPVARAAVAAVAGRSAASGPPRTPVAPKG